MKTTMISLVLLITLTISSYGQVFVTNCPTIEQQQAAYNRSKANAIVVTNTYTQQLQTYYAQLATYYQQLDKDNQQKAKDAQQIDKDIQQLAKDQQQAAFSYSLPVCDELDQFLVVVTPLLGTVPCESIREEFIRIHANRSGGGDGTNPGGHGNINGFDNPHH